ncbi:endonuclease dU [Thermosphaera sp.]|uniref:UPF0215 protein ENP55_03595 n=1 Tax=Thermosphaera aggregans TaxID=54254 RepID=A0A7C2BKM6_9CREN
MRVEGFDDGFFPLDFKGRKGTTVIAGVELDNGVLTRIGYGVVTVDARDSERVVTAMSKHMTGELVFLDGVTYSGFDVVDPDSVHAETGKPVIVVQHHPLNLDRIREALVKHFPDWAERFRVISKVASSMLYVETPWKPVLIYPAGLSFDEAVDLYKRNCIYSPLPEALRIADMVASSISRLRLFQI